MPKPLAIAAALAAFLPSLAVAAQGGDKAAPEGPVFMGIQRATFDPPPVISDRLDGLKINVTQINYPGVPERSACRFLVRATNGGTQVIATHAMLRTYDSYKGALNTWLVPTGSLAPGQSIERIYSCKTAQFVELDRGSATGWPGRCLVNGEERSPCPAVLNLETNIGFLPPPENPKK